MKSLVVPSLLLLLVPLACGGDPADGVAGLTITVPSGHRLGGTATGVPAGTGLTLTDAAAGRAILVQDGPFWFEQRIPTGTPYSVQVEGVVPGKFCSIANASGVMPPAELTSLLVACQAVGAPAGP